MDDPEQLRLDLDDANKRLENLQHAMAEKEDAEERVRELTKALAQAKRRVKESQWKLGLLMGREKRR